jgi:hypothetical protein
VDHKSEEKTEGDNAQEGQAKRMQHIMLMTLIVILLLVSISGFFFVIRTLGYGSQLATNTGTPTPTPTPTSIYLETPPAQSEFYDTFKNNALGWSVASTTGYYRMVKHGELTLVNTNVGTTLVESLPTNSIFDNFTVIVDLSILKADVDDSVGIYVRGDTNLEHDYRVDLNGNGTFDIAKEYLDSRNTPQSVILIGPKSEPALNPQGELNTITLTMDGPQLQLSINNVMAAVVTDGDYMSGQVALFVRLGENSKYVAASFSKVEIDKLPGTPVGAG